MRWRCKAAENINQSKASSIHKSWKVGVVHMASTTTSTPLSLSSSSSSSSPLINAKAPLRLQTSQCGAPNSYIHLAKTAAYCRKFARGIATMATGEAPAEVAVTTETQDLEIVKTFQEAWDKVEDKYAVTSLGLAGGVALLLSAGLVSAIDRVPLIPGVLELVGIGYSGWFVYKNLVSEPDRVALIQKIKGTYSDIIGSS